MGKTSKGRIPGGEILKWPGSDAGCRDNEEEESMSKKDFCRFMYCITQYICSTVTVNGINVYRVWRCCIMEVEQRNSKTLHKNWMSLLEVNSISGKSFISLACLELWLGYNVDILSFSRALEASKTSWLYMPTKIYRQNIERRILTLLVVKGPTKSDNIEVHVEKVGHLRSTQR